MLPMRGLAPVLLAVAGGLAVTACSTVQQAGNFVRTQLASPETPPEYQPGLEYLPVRTPRGPAWMVRAYADSRPGASTPVLVWYAKPDLMLRTEGGRLVGARGFARDLHWLDAGSCPAVTTYPKLTRSVTCELVRNSASGFGLRQSVRIDPPRLLSANWEDLPGPLLLVREKVLAGDLPGSYYLFSMQGQLLRSRQWLAPDFWMDISAAVGREGPVTVPTVATTPAVEPVTDVPVAPAPAAPVPASASAAPAPVASDEVAPAPVAAEPVAAPSAPMVSEASVEPVAANAEPAPSTEAIPDPAIEPESVPAPASAPTPTPSPEPASATGTNNERVVPGQPRGFVRKVR